MENAVRRSFAKSFGSKAALIAHPLGAAMKVADTLRIGDRRHKYTATRSLMGTQVSIVGLHQSKDAAQSAVTAAFSEMERLSAIFDRRRTGTPVSELNETGKLSDVPFELFELLVRAQDYYQRSNGTFDVTVLPVLEMLQKNRDPKGRLMLSQSDLDDALALVGSVFVDVSKNGISFNKSAMSVTLDGIGRGYIVDRASDIMVENGVENHLIIAGGDIRARGKRAPGQPWIVTIENPYGSAGCLGVIQLADSAVSTSGGCEFYFDAERACYHVPTIAARMGLSISVTAPSLLEADALSTSAFAMKPQDGLRFINTQNESECLINAACGTKVFSRNWKSQVGI